MMEGEKNLREAYGAGFDGQERMRPGVFDPVIDSNL